MKYIIVGAIIGVAIVFLLCGVFNYNFDARLWTEGARENCKYLMLWGLIVGGVWGVFYDANPK